jgi:Fe2+ transport system protein FeoA
MKPLSELRVGERGVVRELAGNPASKRRLLSMGFVPGAEVEVLRVAPMGDPVAFAVKGYCISLRKDEAAQVAVEQVEEMSLASAPTDTELLVAGIRAGWGMRHRLRRLGIGPGTRLVKKSGPGHGRVLIAVGDREEHLGHGIARRLLVQFAGERG